MSKWLITALIKSVFRNSKRMSLIYSTARHMTFKIIVLTFSHVSNNSRYSLMSRDKLLRNSNYMFMLVKIWEKHNLEKIEMT